ncbi:MAG: carbohydrate ABC transporter permease [Candidatus Methanomethylicaceae archaeon]
MSFLNKVITIFVISTILLFFDGPIVFVIWTSFRDYGAILAGQFFGFHYSLANYFNVFFNPGYAFSKGLINSILVTLFTTFMVLIISFPAAYALARFKISGSLSSYILSIRLLPPIVFAVPLLILLYMTGLNDTIIGLIIVYLAFNIPLAIFLLRSFIIEIPIEIEEAAIIDGCSKFQTMLRITFPLSKPGLVAAGILTFIMTWSEYLFALLFTLKNAITINVVASQFVTQHTIRYGEIAAAMVIGMLPTVIFLSLIQKHLVKGLTFGAVKGA